MWFRRNGCRLAASVAAVHLIILFILVIHHFASSPKQSSQPIAVRIQLPKAAAVAKQAPPLKKLGKTKPAAPKAKAAPPTLEKKRSPPKKSAPEIKLPSFLEKSPVETVEASLKSAVPSSFGQCLAALLQEQLQLPEIGEVEARIFLEAPGRISRVEILDTRSQKNADWLKNQLPRLSVPCFNDFSIGDATLEFTITFRNVEKI